MRYAFLSCFLAASAVVLPVQSPAFAQTAPPAAPAAATAQTAVSNDDFRRLALIGLSFDYESSRLALTQSRLSRVKRYAESLVSNFRFDYARLANGASFFASIPALPADPNAVPAPFSDTRRAAMLTQLSKAEGREFDKLYLDMQVGTRQELLGLYQAYAQTGSDPALLAIARSQLPLLQQQYDYIRRVAGR